MTALLQQAEAAYAGGNWEHAERLCAQVLAAQPDDVAALNLLATILAQRQRPAEAERHLRRALTVAPANAVLHNNYGNVLRDLRRLPEAAASYQRALELDPRYAVAHGHRGAVLRELGEIGAARACYERALELAPGDAELHYGLGVLLQEVGLATEALARYGQALALRPGYAEALYNQAAALRQLRRLEEAVRSYGAVIQALPNFAPAYNNRGGALLELGRHEAALQDLERAQQLNARLVEAQVNGGHALVALKRPGEARASYERALALVPDWPGLLGAALHAQLLTCDWEGLDSRRAELEARVAAGAPVAEPFTLLATCESPALLRQCAETATREIVRQAQPPPAMVRRARRDVIRLGYFSADFHAHAMTMLITGVLECHARERFSVVALSLGPARHDAARERVVRAVDQFVDVDGESDREVAELARALEIDIALDLNGFTRHGRPGIFACRAAPVQVNYLGFVGTMGTGLVDYMIVDHTVVTGAQRAFYAEQLAWLPDSYFPNDRQRVIASVADSRSSHGLPADGFVFCCFNNPYKITPRVFDLWMRVLRRVPGSTLWLLAEDARTIANLRREAASRGVDSARLVAAAPLPLPEHLARHRHADLFLDTYPCGAHTTASDALWAGLPVLAQQGEPFASRVASSLLNAIGMPELAVTSAADYEALAVALACDPERLRQLRERLDGNRLRTPLFDAPRYTRSLERAYEHMYDRHQSGLPPADFSVPGSETT